MAESDIQISSLSTPDVYVPVKDTINGVDPTTAPVTIAFPVTGEQPSQWVTAQWTTVSNIHYAYGLAAGLAAGYYDIYVKFTLGPETVVLKAGVLEVF